MGYNSTVRRVSASAAVVEVLNPGGLAVDAFEAAVRYRHCSAVARGVALPWGRKYWFGGQPAQGQEWWNLGGTSRGWNQRNCRASRGESRAGTKIVSTAPARPRGSSSRAPRKTAQDFIHISVSRCRLAADHAAFRRQSRSSERRHATRAAKGAARYRCLIINFGAKIFSGCF